MRALFGMICAVLPVQALALSCMPWDVGDGYVAARQSEQTYVVVLGRLTFDETRLPRRLKGLMDSPSQEVSIEGRLEGFALSRNGFDTVFSTRVDLMIHCFGPWCPTATSGAQYLAFITGNIGRLSVRLDPCAPMGFENPTEDQINAVVNCLRKGQCDGVGK